MDKSSNIFFQNNQLVEDDSRSFPSLAALFLWLLFISSVGLLVYYQTNTSNWNQGQIFRINGFTILIWITVFFFSAIVSTYAKNYLKGFKYHNRFTLICLGFTASVALFVISNHLIPFLLSWLLMGFFMARLIGIDGRWREAQAASKFAQRFFLLGSAFLSAGILILFYFTNRTSISDILENLDSVPRIYLVSAAILIILSTLIQSAIYPFHRWLLSAMTAPTPASALMHAGFVNGSGILLALLSTLFISSNTLTILFIIGGITAIIAQFTKLLQVNVKQKLACSTIAQMGFMIMQCGLGFFNAAVAHLILHGFYKAYLFLSSGEEIENTAPNSAEKISIKPLQAIAVLAFGFAGAVLFAFLTGKTNMNDSSIFLTLIVAITVGQATYNIVKEKSLSIAQRILLPVGLFVIGIVVYSLIYNGVTILMSEMPMIEVPQKLSIWHISFGIIFLLGFFIMKLGIYKKSSWLYVKLLNDSQPYSKSTLTTKNTIR